MRNGSKIMTRTARKLRQAMRLPEVLLWRAFRQRPAGLKFRRQHPFGPYILDFYCAATSLVIEIDGEAHNRGDRPQRDTARTAWLVGQGLQVERIPAVEVLQALGTLVAHIVTLCRPLHQPSAGPPPRYAERKVFRPRGTR